LTIAASGNPVAFELAFPTEVAVMRTSSVGMTTFARSTHARTRPGARRQFVVAGITAFALTSLVGGHVAMAAPYSDSRVYGGDFGMPTAAGAGLAVAVARPSDHDWLPTATSQGHVSRDTGAETGVPGAVGFSLGASSVKSGSEVMAGELLPSSPSSRPHPALVLFFGGLVGLGFLARGRKRRAASPWQ
jgi:hypothetical protein